MEVKPRLGTNKLARFDHPQVDYFDIYYINQKGEMTIKWF